jgi:N-acetylglucosaminyl-diphospho-decaprenol L-rhamnosyltransferase
VSLPIAAVVVDHDTGPLLEGCVRSLLAQGASPVVVVENGQPDSSTNALTSVPSDDLIIVHLQENRGYGAGVNRGLAVVAGLTPRPEFVLVSNADLEVHPGALDILERELAARPAWAILGPRIFDGDHEVYPSVRQFPSFVDAAGHALLAPFNPENRFTRRYKPGAPESDDTIRAGWVSGSCFLARRSALEELGGFDEIYFMYAEDMDLCWRAHEAGWGVGYAGAAGVTHIQGVSTARHPYKMMLAHHRSALRFSVRTTKGWRRAALPLAVVVLGLRMAVASTRLALQRT